MRHESHRTAEREEKRVRGGDISDHASELLTDELRDATGRDDVRAVPGERSPHATDAGASHSPMIAALLDNRALIGITFFVLLTVGGIIAITTGEWWALVVATVVHAFGTLAIAGGAIQFTTEVEHVSAGTAARLQQEGVGDPDRLLSDLVDEVAGTRGDDPTPEVVAGGRNRTDAPGGDRAHATAQQRTALTPTDESRGPAGERSIMDAMSWAVIAGLVAMTIVAAVVLSGPAWVVPALFAVLAAGWLVLEGAMLRADPPRTRADSGPDVHGARRLTVLGIVVLAGVAIFMILMGIVVDDLG